MLFIKKLKLTHIAPFIFLLGLFALFFNLIIDKKNNLKPSMMIGRQFPTNLNVMDLNNNYVDLNQAFDQKDYKLVNVFASWCVSCKAEHKDLIKLSSMGIKIYGLNIRDKKEDVKKYLIQNGNPYEIVLFDEKGLSAASLGVIGVPESFLLDSNNKIILHYRGTISIEEIMDAPLINK